MKVTAESLKLAFEALKVKFENCQSEGEMQLLAAEGGRLVHLAQLNGFLDDLPKMGDK